MKKLWLGAWIVLGAAFVSAGAARLKEPILRRWQQWRYPPGNTAVSPLGEDILREHDRESARRFRKEYDRVEARLRQSPEARGRGADLEAKMAAAARLAVAGRFHDAMILLSIVDMKIPVKNSPVSPAGPGAGMQPEETLKPHPVGFAGSGKRTRRGPRAKPKKRLKVRHDAQ